MVSPQGKKGSLNLGSSPLHSAYQSQCPVYKWHRFKPVRPVFRFTKVDDDGGMHQLVVCRYCDQMFDSFVRTIVDENGRFALERDLITIGDSKHCVGMAYNGGLTTNEHAAANETTIEYHGLEGKGNKRGGDRNAKK